MEKKPDSHIEIEFSGERVVPGKTPYGMLQEHVGRYVFASSLIPENCHILDVACGVGYGTTYLAKRGGKVIGGDIDKQAIAYANQTYHTENNASFVLLDCMHLPFCNQHFDIIVSIETLEHLSDYEDFLKECKRVMKENGLFICTTPNGRVYHPLGLGSKGYHVHEFSPDELEKLLKRYWKNVALYGQCNSSRREMAVRLAMNLAFDAGESILSAVPGGGRVKSYIRGVLDHHFRSYPAWVEIYDELLDKKYAFSPLGRSLPTFLGAAATDGNLMESEGKTGD